MGLDTEDILHRFQQWLTQANQELEQVGEAPSAVPAEAPAPPVGVLQLVEAFTALRHELKLQTKSARGLEESLHTRAGGTGPGDRAIPQRPAAGDRRRGKGRAAAGRVADRNGRGLAARRKRRWPPRSGGCWRKRRSGWPNRLEQRFAQQSPWQRWRAGPWQAEVLQLCRRLVAETQNPVLSTLRRRLSTESPRGCSGC